ncbi:tail protein [Cyanophage SS120-1]|uniref:Tail tube A n=1 Tax=Cyanophage SS120-1 TaxID=616674 RepID=M1UGU0_9CAUD|nr:tail protein [Cyanophage SS120-1]AGG54537.1 tail tube A [Cyanophage SS120-1]
MLDEVNHALQSEGWVFNTEQDYPFTPDNNKNIEIPANVLSLDKTEWSKIEPIIRKPPGAINPRLYDKREHTYEFDDIQYLKVVWYFEFIDLPEVFKQYITIRAANLFANRSVGSNEVVKYSEKEENVARAAVMEYETQQGDYNIFNDSAGGREFQTYLPYKAISR